MRSNRAKDNQSIPVVEAQSVPTEKHEFFGTDSKREIDAARTLAIGESPSYSDHVCNLFVQSLLEGEWLKGIESTPAKLQAMLDKGLVIPRVIPTHELHRLDENDQLFFRESEISVQRIHKVSLPLDPSKLGDSPVTFIKTPISERPGVTGYIIPQGNHRTFKVLNQGETESEHHPLIVLEFASLKVFHDLAGIELIQRDYSEGHLAWGKNHPVCLQSSNLRKAK